MRQMQKSDNIWTKARNERRESEKRLSPYNVQHVPKDGPALPDLQRHFADRTTTSQVTSSERTAKRSLSDFLNDIIILNQWFCSFSCKRLCICYTCLSVSKFPPRFPWCLAKYSIVAFAAVLGPLRGTFPSFPRIFSVSRPLVFDSSALSVNRSCLNPKIIIWNLQHLPLFTLNK